MHLSRFASFFAAGLLLGAPLSLVHAQSKLLITELQSNQSYDSGEDFWELTNVGTLPVDLGGWSWDDDSATPGVIVIGDGTVITPGESIVFTAKEASAFRAWWGLDASVRVISDPGAPGFGQNDGIFLFDGDDMLATSFSYGAGDFTRSDGAPAAGGHAGLSAGGSLVSQSVVIDPAFGIESPRYNYADGSTLGTFASAADASDLGSPGSSGLSTGGGATIELTLTVVPVEFSESASHPAATGTVTRSGSTAAELVISLSSSDPTEAAVPATVTIPADAASVDFPVTAVDDSFPDGEQTLTLTATAPGASPGLSPTLTVLDDGDVLSTRLLLTELQSNQSSGAPSGAEDYWELTNLGEDAVDLSGYSWHDGGRSAAAAAAWALPAGTLIDPGEAVLFTSADPSAFRAWWGLDDSTRIFQAAAAPGLGKNDGIALFDESGNEVFFFSYAAGGFVTEDGSDASGGHAGLSAGGAEAFQALVWVPTSRYEEPRYTFADGLGHGTFAAAEPATDLGSPGSRGMIVPKVGIADASVEEGTGGTSLLTFIVTRSHTDTAFSVDYRVAEGTATEGVDYAGFTSGTLRFDADGEPTAAITLLVNSDYLGEDDETLTVTLSNVVNTAGSTHLGTALATGTIVNDDWFSPTIAQQPADTAVATGGVTQLTVDASGYPAPTYQWYEGASGDTSQPIEDATSASFTTPPLSATTAFWVRVSNSAGEVHSAAATVSVLEPVTQVDLSQYIRVGRYDLPEPTRTPLPAGTPAHNLLGQEASGVTYNWDTDTLFLVGDGGRSVTQVSRTGELVDTMTLALGSSPQGTEFYDPEGITYVGGGEFVFSEERDRQLVRFTYVAGATLTRAQTRTVKIGTYVDNTGTEGLSYDPLTGGFILLKEVSPIGVFQSAVDFDAGTASNGGADAVNSENLFDPAALGVSDVAGVFALSNLPGLAGQAQESHLLVLSQEDARIVHIDRSGNVQNTLQIVSDVGNLLSVGNQQHEGITMDPLGYIYVVSENGGGGINHPQLWVYAPSSEPNQAPTGLALNNVIEAVEENTSTVSPLKLAEVIILDDGLGNNLLSLSGPDAAAFRLVGNDLYLAAGTVLDFEARTSYAVTIEVDDPTLGEAPDAELDFTLTVLDVKPEEAPLPALIISEVAPWSSGDSPVGVDWFELTNTSDNPVDISGWKIDDASAAFDRAAPLEGITTLAPGEAVIFLETDDRTTAAAAFLANWFGGEPPAGLQIGSYTGSGLGFSSNGDGVYLFDAAGGLRTSVEFGASPSRAPYASFDNTAGLSGASITLLSSVDRHGAFLATGSGAEIGSPGYAAPAVLAITEVAPWSSGNSPLGADWFEVTNLGSRAVDISGWRMDDGSESPAAAVPLAGITRIAPGESVIFVEYDSTVQDVRAAFLATWFGDAPPAGLQIGGYSGSGVGLSTGGDAVNLYDTRTPTPARRASVSFGASPSSAPYGSFDNSAGLDLVTLGTLSQAGVNGAFVAAGSSAEVGSPGTVAAEAEEDAFLRWLAENGYTSLGFREDTDGDGMPDFIEFFFGQSPNDPQDTGNLPALHLSAQGLELRMTVNAASGLPGYLQISGDLEAWSDASLGADYEILEETDDGDLTAIRYRLLPGDRQRLFLRVEVLGESVAF